MASQDVSGLGEQGHKPPTGGTTPDGVHLGPASGYSRGDAAHHLAVVSGAVGSRTQLSGTFTRVNTGTAAIYSHLPPFFICVTPKLQRKTAKNYKTGNIWSKGKIQMFTSVPWVFNYSVIIAGLEPMITIPQNGQNPSVSLESCLMYKSSRQAAPYFMLLYKK